MMTPTLAVPTYLLAAAQQLVTASTPSPSMTILYQNYHADTLPELPPPNRLQRRAALARQRRRKK
jgi:hypothetical protein